MSQVCIHGRAVSWKSEWNEPCTDCAELAALRVLERDARARRQGYGIDALRRLDEIRAARPGAIGAEDSGGARYAAGQGANRSGPSTPEPL